jgi:glycosyltransferase involved in cell wall biosynthesis
MSRASDDQWSRTSQIRILQIVENLDNRAVESWLFRIFLRASRQDPRYHWTFFCVLPEQGVYDEAVRQAGGEVIYSRYELGNKIAFTTSLRKVMREGQYDILHCHHDIMSAAYLLTSWGLPFRQRIIHLHNTALGLPTPSRFKQTLLSQPMRQVCLRLADQIVGISEDALSSIIGNEPRRRGRDSVVHYGIDTELFAPPIPDKVSFRQQLGFASETKILLFVGRMVDYKNPCFVVEVLEHLRKLDPDFVAVFAGTGPFEADVKQLAEKNSLKRHIKLLGFRNDVPQVMHAADVLIWPSLEDPKEGS